MKKTSTRRFVTFFNFFGIVVLTLLALLPHKTSAQATITFDTEYWLALPTTSPAYRAGSRFLISTFDQDATITLSAPLVPGFVPKTINIAANSTGNIDISDPEVALLVNNVGNSVAGTGVHIETTAKISIYYEPGSVQQSPDLLSLKGGEALGTDFLVPMQQESSIRLSDGRQGFLVLATEDNTTVTITPKEAIIGHVAGTPFTVTLQRGQTYFAETPVTVLGASGSRVVSDKPVAITVFSEMMFGGGSAYDLGSEQIVPIKNIGTDYIVVAGYRTAGDFVYITAVEDNTEVRINGSVVATLSATDTYTLETDGSEVYFIQSTKKVTTLHHSGVNGEESFCLLPAQLGCNGSNIVQVVRATDNFFGVNIIAPTNQGFSVNGDASVLAPAEFQEVPGAAGWYYARVPVTFWLVAAGNPVIVTNSDPAVKFHMGVFHTNSGGARYGYFSSYSGSVINFPESEKEVCAGQSVSFAPQIVSTDPIISYTWTDQGGDIVSTEEVLVLDNVTTANSGTYTLTIATAVCSVEERVQLTVRTLTPPIIGFRDPLAICIPDAVLEVKSPDPSWLSYQWYMDDVLIPGATGVTYQPTTGQTGVFTLTAVAAGGCVTPMSEGITIDSNCPVPFVCNGSAYLISSPSGTTPSTLYIVDAANPTIIHATITPSVNDRYNGIGYNFEDNLLYGFATGDAPTHNPGDVVQIDAQGTVRRLGVPTAVAGQVPGMPTWTTSGTGGRVVYATGVVGLANKLYTMVQNNTSGAVHLATVDLTTMQYTTLRLSADIGGLNDLAFSPYDGMLYGLRLNQLVQINPNNGNQQVVSPSNGPVAAAAAGGAWNDVQGRVYFYSNGGTSANGGLRLYRYNPANGNFVNLAPADGYPTFDATACFPTSLEKRVIMPTDGLEPGDVVEFEFSIYNSQMLPMTYDFEDELASSDLSWEINSVSPAAPGGGTVNTSGQTLTINGITVPPTAATGGPLTFRVSIKIADAAAYETCYTNQASISSGGMTILSDNPDTPEANDPTLFCLNPCDLPAPVSGGNQQACFGETLTATATAPAGVEIIWYDAPTGGNVVLDPSLETVGTVTYYAAADDGVCISPSRTPVTLNIAASPVLDPIADIASCGPFVFPAIAGENLSGNEAYYTEPNGAGTKYLPGDEFTTVGAATFYVYDEIAALDNCAGSLNVMPNTTYTSKDDLDELAGLNTQVIYSGAVNPAFWAGTASQDINYNPADLVIEGQTYNTIIGTVDIADTDNCFGTDVAISADVTLTNNGPSDGMAGVGYVAIINTATNTRLYQGTLPNAPHR